MQRFILLNPSFLICFFLILIGTNAYAQPACPAVSVTPSTVNICSGCTTLTAAVQGTVATTSYSVAPTPYVPFPFNAGTSVLVNIDDTWSDAINIPFCFQFYGNTYNQIVIGSNEIVTFDASQANGFCPWTLTSSSGIPDASLPTNSIMGPYQDIDPTNMGSIYWQVVGTAPCRAFIISFYQIPYYGDPNSVSTASCSNPLFATSQIVLYETTNIIDVYIQNKDNCTGWNNGFGIEGIQDAFGSSATVVAGRNNTVWTAVNDAQRFTPTGAPQYSLTWYNAANTAIGTTPSISVCPTDTATYTARVVNNTCGGPITVSAVATVNYTGIQSINITSTSVYCSGNTGTATAHATGSTAPYTYSWAPGGQTSQTAVGLSVGTYTVTVTGANLCSLTNTVTIAASPPVTFSFTNIINVNCFGTNTGSASVNVLTGSSPYTYLWSNSQTSVAATGLGPGTYTVVVTDAHNCSHTDSVHITSSPALTHSFSGRINDDCFGNHIGTITVNVSGGTPAYTYLWSNSQTSATATGLGAGTFTVVVTDAHNCSFSDTVHITSPSALTHTFPSIVNIDCFGNNTGSATISVSGGTPPYSYSWSNSQTSAAASPLTAGTYTITVTDAHNCSFIDSVHITTPLALSHTFPSIINVDCFGNPTGSATVSVTGGTLPYTYQWSNSQTSAAATALAAGTYTIVVTDAHSCSFTDSVHITSPLILAHTFPIITNVDCFGNPTGSAQISVTGGTPAYSYSWNTIPVQITAFIDTLYAGVFTVTVIDAHGCTFADSVIITTPTGLGVFSPSVTDVNCYGNNNGSATVTPFGGTPGYTDYWYPANQTGPTATGLAPGVDTVRITDNNGCIIKTLVQITQPDSLSEVLNHVNILCYGDSTGTASVAVAGGTPPYTYLWTPGASTSAAVTGLKSGSYSILITDAHGCTHTSSFILTQPAAPLSAVTSVVNVLCNPDSTGAASVAMSGGTPLYSYLWNTGQTSAAISNLPHGNYSVMITDAHGCRDSASVTVTQPSLFTVTPSHTNILCFGNSTGTASILASGGTTAYTYLWTPGNATSAAITGLAAGNYTVQVTDAHACTRTSSFILTQPAAPLSAVSSFVNILCNPDSTGSAGVVVSGGTASYSYLWNTGQTSANISNLPHGNYSVMITDAHGCRDSASVTVAQPQLLTTDSSQVNILCFGAHTGTAGVTPSGGTSPYTYLWNPGGATSASISGLASGTYSVLITDAHACTRSHTFLLTQPASPLSIASSFVNVLCHSNSTGSAAIVVSGGTPAYSYFWSSGQTSSSISNLPAGSYSVMVTDNNGCRDSSTVLITQPTQLSASISHDTSICFGASITESSFASGGTGPYTYLWSPGGAITSSITVSPIVNSSYTVQVTDAHGCAALPLTTAVTIVHMPAPSISVSPADIVFFPETLCFTGDTANAVSWLWDFGDNTTGSGKSICHDYTKMGQYCVTLLETNNIGCSDSVPKCVTEVGAIIPNVFSPNGDGINDMFFISMTMDGITNYTCEIYDRWGIKMTELSLAKPTWDGNTRSGAHASDGTYYYIFSVSWGNNLNIHKQGFLSLVR